MRKRSILSVGFLLGGWASLASAASFTFTTLHDPLAVAGTIPLGINNEGQVVGTYVDSSGNTQSFLYSGGIYYNLNTPAGPINDSGQILLSNNVLDSGGTLTPIPPDPLSSCYNGSCATQAYGFNDSDQIVGYFETADILGTDMPNYQDYLYGFVDTNGSFTTIPTPYGGYSTTYALGINNLGMIVGYYRQGGIDFPGPFQGFLDSGGTITTVDDPLACSGCSAFGGTQARAINDAGQIIGWYSSPGGVSGFLYVNGTYSDIIDPSAPQYTEPIGINDAGDVIGNFFDTSGVDQGFIATPSVASPEPSTFLLAFGAAAAIALVRKRRQSN